MWVIFDHLRPSGHIMPDHVGDRGVVRLDFGASRSPAYLGNLQLLERPGHAQILRANQVRAAPAPALREMIPRVVRLGPAHRRPRRARLLAPVPLARLPFGGAARRCLRGGLRPGTSSPEGGIEEFWLLRDSARSSRATRSRSSAACSACARSSSRGPAICSSRAAQPGQSGTAGGTPDTSHDLPEPASGKQAGTLSRPAKPGPRLPGHPRTLTCVRSSGAARRRRRPLRNPAGSVLTSHFGAAQPVAWRTGLPAQRAAAAGRP